MPEHAADAAGERAYICIYIYIYMYIYICIYVCACDVYIYIYIYMPAECHRTADASETHAPDDPTTRRPDDHGDKVIAIRINVIMIKIIIIIIIIIIYI